MGMVITDVSHSKLIQMPLILLKLLYTEKISLISFKLNRSTTKCINISLETNLKHSIFVNKPD